VQRRGSESQDGAVSKNDDSTARANLHGKRNDPVHFMNVMLLYSLIYTPTATANPGPFWGFLLLITGAPPLSATDRTSATRANSSDE